MPFYDLVDAAFRPQHHLSLHLWTLSTLRCNAKCDVPTVRPPQKKPTIFISFSTLLPFAPLLHHAHIYQLQFPAITHSTVHSTVHSSAPVIKRYFIMADFVFVIEMAGLQHGNGQFTIKRVPISPVHEGTMATFTYDTSFLFHHSDSAIRTYHYTTRHIHGIALDEPGLPYSLRRETISITLKKHMFGALRPIPHEYEQEPQILLVTKGTEKIRLIKELVPMEGFFKNLIVRDPANYGCPPASRLLGGGRPATETTAALFSTWFGGRFRTFIAPLIPPRHSTVLTRRLGIVEL